jgi:Ca-activated chloride channel family protein
MGNLIKNFHFSDPIYLVFLLAIPLFWLFVFKRKISHDSYSYLKKFIDEHLLKELLQTNPIKNLGHKFLIFFSLIWILLVISIASPRWKFSEQKTYSTNSNLVILLDLSTHMKVRDIAPSRINKAKQIIADILQESSGINISLTAFAKIPHIITPLTSDIKTITTILPHVDTDLPYIKGSDLPQAIKEVISLLPDNSSENHILLISSGNLENYKINNDIKNILNKKNIKISTILVATKNGAPLINKKDEFEKDQFGKIIISKANSKILKKIADDFEGKYFNSADTPYVAKDFLDVISKKKSANLSDSVDKKIWQEEYRWLIACAMLLVFILKRNFIFILPFLFFIDSSNANIFLNTNQEAQKLFNKGKFKQSSTLFSDSYNIGVAKFKANDFAGAEAEFLKTSDQDVNARYNLANSLFKQNKFSEAKENYQKILDIDPHHHKAKYNLKIIEKILKKEPKKDQQKQENKNKKEQNQKKNETEKGEDKEQKKNKTKNKKDGEQPKSQQKKVNKDKDNTKETKEKNSSDNDKKKINKNKKKKVENKKNKNKTQLNETTKQILQRINSDPRIFLQKKFYFKERDSL